MKIQNGKIKINKISLLQILFIVSIMVTMFSQEINPFFNDMGKYIVGILFIFIYFIVNSQKIILNSVDRLFFNVFIVPWLYLGVFSIIGDVINCNPLNFISRSMSNILWVVLGISFAFVSYKLFGKRNVNFVFIACIMNYTVVIIKYIQEVGLSGLIASFNYKDIVNSERLLEVHGLTYIFGVFILYFIFHKNIEHRFVKIIISSCYFLMGFKRIAIAAIIVTIVLTVLIKKVKKAKTYRIFILLTSFISIISSLFMLYIIKYEKLSVITKKLSLETNGRNYIWSLFSNNISFLPVPYGYGLGYTDRKLEILQLPQLHNDIMRIFVGVGVVIAILFFWKLFYINTKRLQNKLSLNCSKLYLLILVYIFINMFFSNIGFSYWLYFCFAGIMINIFYEDIKEKDDLWNKEDKDVDGRIYKKATFQRKV